MKCFDQSISSIIRKREIKKFMTKRITKRRSEINNNNNNNNNKNVGRSLQVAYSTRKRAFHFINWWIEDHLKILIESNKIK